MWFLNWIISYLLDVAGDLLDLSHEVRDWGSWARWAADFLVDVADRFARIAIKFRDFNDWVEYADDVIGDILSWSNIRSLIRSWLYGIEDVLDWFQRWTYWIGREINDWWAGILPYLIDYIDDIETWTVAQINTFEATLLAVISDIELWTVTEFNIIRDWILLTISDIETWALTQINAVKSAILAIIGDLTLWTQTEINTIRDLLTAIIDWDAFTKWVNDWWAERLLDIDSLINSAFTIRQGFWEGWQDIRDEATEFFTDPLSWLEAKFTDWFLGGE